MTDRSNPAFPQAGVKRMNDEGLSKREFFAGRVLPALVANAYAVNQASGADAWFVTHEEVAAKAYVIADVMLKAGGDPDPRDREIEQLNGRIEMLEQLRPHWAQGHTSDSMAAQASTAALSSIWQLLGVDNQTAAMEKLRRVIAGA